MMIRLACRDLIGCWIVASGNTLGGFPGYSLLGVSVGGEVSREYNSVSSCTTIDPKDSVAFLPLLGQLATW